MSTGLAVSSISSSVANETVMTAFSQLSICPSTPKSELSQQSLCSFSLILFHLLLGIILAIPMGILVWNWQKNYVKKR
jgi:ABC-type proline/glycine betaine transport system permease subunit